MSQEIVCYSCDQRLYDDNKWPECHRMGVRSHRLMVRKEKLDEPNVGDFTDDRYFCDLTCLHRWIEVEFHGGVLPKDIKIR